MCAKRRPKLAQAAEVRPETALPPEAISATEPEMTPPSPEEVLALIQQLQELRQAHLLTLVASPDVILRGDIVEQVYEQLHQIGHVPQIDLFLHSVGGQTELPWRLITLIREYCQKFCVLIPAFAHSAATHLAMGADEIVMGPLSELSPVDPARTHPLLPGQKEDGSPLAVSAQDLRHCVEFIKKEVGDSSPEAKAAIVGALFDKIHPLAIGAIQQSYDLARLISTKALSSHMNPATEKEQIERIVNVLSDEFFSHHYRIGRKEAKEIGLKVVDAEGELWEKMWALYKNYRAYFTLARLTGNEKEPRAARPILWIDSVQERRILEQIQPLNQKGPTIVNWLTSAWTQD
ncbi:MAG: hypothetical protein DPW09_24045 [Anaerolineae bacterium]|nr:hypothetical protein [Anaerolineales bacterium]MCQ3976515.1 hypothetical protein [Anaerolineae bacterium]